MQVYLAVFCEHLSRARSMFSGMMPVSNEGEFAHQKDVVMVPELV